MDLFNYSRRKTNPVQVGCLTIGGDAPVRLQSMTNTNTLDTEACVAQALRIASKGGELVRLTTQGVREAQNLEHIAAGLRQAGCHVPIVADVHFNPNVADVAALYADKVRINPGNYVDAARTFRQLTYTDEEYAREVQKIGDRLTPLLRLCREHGTALRIGVNHGSLSDRIMSRYGDTPAGMVESCMEFLRVCVAQHFGNVVISIKASNTVVMVRTVRLLVATMEREGMAFPLHLGVTEAGEGEDGRIKSALGIGALLGDGLGDTIRVSLSEPPEDEIPVARKLADYVATRDGAPHIDAQAAPGFNYLEPIRRNTRAVGNIGADQVPVVIAVPNEGRVGKDIWGDEPPAVLPDYLYVGRRLVEDATWIDKSDNQPTGIPLIIDYPNYHGLAGTYPAFTSPELPAADQCDACRKFFIVSLGDIGDALSNSLHRHPEAAVILRCSVGNRPGEQRAMAHWLNRLGLLNPLICQVGYSLTDLEDLQIRSAADMGAAMFDGLCDGICLTNHVAIGQSSPTLAQVVSTAFGILQAGRLRTTKTEYISCPSCGRTLYDLPQTIARIKSATAHLRGLKIAIMGCIVNGPGEMADADYGYVGAGRGRVSLYRRRECVERGIPEEQAVEKLIELIRLNGDWHE